MLNSIRKIIQSVNAAKDLQTALDLIVHQVRRSMRADVCSVYLHFPQTNNFILMATEGLNQAALKIALSADQGLVGLVASRSEPINLEDAASHPNYRYIEATGEEQFCGFLGVPIIHHRKVLGTLIIQQRCKRSFTEDEEALLITTSAQLAGIIAHAEATGGGLRRDVLADDQSINIVYTGVSRSGGVAIGQVVIMAPPADLETVPDRPCVDPEQEVAAFQIALNAVRRKIKVVGRTLARILKGQEHELFEVYMRMLDDNALAGEVIQHIRQGQWAQGALRRVVEVHVTAFEIMDDPYLRERATDIRDLGRRVLAELQQSGTQHLEFPASTVLVAQEASAAMLGEVPPHKLKAIVSITGSSNSHAAILARSMGIPTVMGAVDFPYTRLEGKEVIIDGYNGHIYRNASHELRQHYQKIVAEEASFVKEATALRDLPAMTLDQRSISLFVNTSLPLDVPRSLDKGAEGVGLYRTEVPFMLKEHFPSEQEQVSCYRIYLQGFAPRPVIMRTLDIGGDKSLPYFPIEEDNPFLGWRGIRVTLDHPEILLVQLRAMLKASAGFNNLRIMLPMITHIAEIEEARHWLDQAYTEVIDEGYELQRPPIGVMIEIPATVYQARQIAKKVDFISVGSNDLTQYLLAVDRDNAQVAELYHAYHPVVLAALQHVALAAKSVRIPVSICGELAGDPGGALLLIAMGYDILSMNSVNIPRIKSVIRNMHFSQAKTMLKLAMQQQDASGVKKIVQQTLHKVGITQAHSFVMRD